MPSIVGHAYIYEKHYMPYLKIKIIRIGKKIEIYRINKFLFIIKKNELNENRLYLRKKILIKITIRDKKKFIKIFHEGQFSGGQFSW